MRQEVFAFFKSTHLMQTTSQANVRIYIIQNLTKIYIVMQQERKIQCLIFLKNSWRNSPEEPRQTEAVAARWQYRGPCGQQSAYPSTSISVFLTGFRYFSFKQLPNCPHEAGLDPVPDPILPEKFPGYSRESNLGPFGWQSDLLTTIPNRWSYFLSKYKFTQRSTERQLVYYKNKLKGKQREATAPIQSLVKLQPWFLSRPMRWKTCLRHNCSLGSCAFSEGPVLGQYSLMMMT